MADLSIYEAIARNLGDVLVKGTPTNCIGSTMESISLLHPHDKQLIGKYTYIYEGYGAGQSRIISNFTPGSNYVTIEPNWSSIPTASSRYLVFDHFEPEDYEHAMNRAMGKAKLIHLLDMVATSAIVATQYEYPIPSGMEWIESIRLVPTNSSDYGDDDEVRLMHELSPRTWDVEKNVGGSYIFCFDARKINLDNLDGEVIRIQGQGRPDFAATLISEELEEFIITNASMLLSSRRINENKEWTEKFRLFRDESKDLEGYIFRYGRGKKVGE